jgi:tetratricopeptide (TPR) repeat protein
VPAFVRLAEASSELDDHVAARDALLTVNNLVADVNDLTPDDRLRVQAVSAIVLRRWNDAVEAYKGLAKRHPDDAGALLDVGRVQEATAKLLEARGTYERAVQLRPGYAAAHLRLAGILADLNDPAALDSFTRAESLFLSESNFEGLIEALLQRGAFLNARGALVGAREALERASTLAKGVPNNEQAMRTRLHLSSVLASEGRFEEAQSLATEAVREAEEADLETVAADGLIDLANALLYQQGGKRDDLEQQQRVAGHLERAVALADKRKAERIRVRALLQLAAAKAHWGDAEGAITLAEEQLPFCQQNGYLRYELTGLNIMSRSLERLGKYERARAMAERVLKIATEIGNEAQQGEALDNLAGQAAAMGILPDAASFWTRSEAIRRSQGDTAILPWDLTNRAEMLIRMGRPADAEPLLREVEAGAAKKIESFVERLRRARVLRALDASIAQRHHATATIARGLIEESAGETDTSGQLARRLLDYAEAELRLRKRAGERRWMDEEQARETPELVYWELAARLAAGDGAGTLQHAKTVLDWKVIAASAELEWRIAAVGASAAKTLGKEPEASALAQRAHRRLRQLQETWADSFAEYTNRPDIRDLLKKAGISWK